MKTFHIIFLTLFAYVSHAGLIIPPGQIVASGVSNSPNFDWAVTNILNDEDYFRTDSNFFVSKGAGREMVFDPNDDSLAFLNTKKATPVGKDIGRVRKSAAVRNAGVDDYNTFGAKQSFTVGNNGSFTGIGVDTGNGNEKFEITGGSRHSGAETTVEISIRSKTDNEKYGAHRGVHNNTSPVGRSPLVGNVMRLKGMGIQEASADGRIKTNPFALEATYTQEDFDATFSLSELQELLNGCLFLGWLNTAVDGDPTSVSGADRWVNAVQGNYDNMPDNPNRHDESGVIGAAYIGTLEDYIAGTETSIAGLSKAAGEIRVGDYGGDPDSNTVWAVIDHLSDFAVVPEPSTYALFSGLLALIMVYFRKK
jgi:hypothetical protein